MKRSLIDYLLTLIIAIVIFAIVAVFLVSFVQGIMGDVVDRVNNGVEETQTVTAEATKESDNKDEPANAAVNDSIVSFLVLGVDASGKNADAIILASVNSTKNCLTCMLIPSNTYSEVDGGRYAIGALYGTKGVSYIKEFVHNETGVNVDYYIVLTMEKISNMIDFVGGIPYSVPQNMYYYDSSQNLKINLKKGNQNLSGDQVVGLLAFKGYSNGVTGRENTQINFIKTFCSTYLKPENITRSKEIYYNAMYNVDTDFSASEFIRIADILFNYANYSANATFQRAPGSAAAGGFYAISSSKATSLFSAYKK